MLHNLLTFLRDVVPKERCLLWQHIIDLENSLFRLDGATISEAVLTGHGHENMDEILVNIKIYLLIGQSRHTEIVEFNAKGIETAIDCLFEFPEKAAICRECGKVQLRKDSDCQECLFLKAFAMRRKRQEVCTICQDHAFRIALPCGHVFHKTCLLSMNPYRLVCPNCRSPVSETIVKSLFGSIGDSDDDDDDDDDEDL